MSKMKLSMKGTLATVLCMGLFLNLLSANVFASPLPESNTSEAVVSEVNQETAPLTIAEEPSQPALENTEVAGTASEESGGATQPGGSSSEQNTAESSTTESSLNESSAESSADGLSSSAAAAKAPLLGVPSPLGVICAGLDSLPKDGDTILYGIVNDTAQTFNVNVPKDLFGNGDITMTVSLAGVYGMAFTDNLASDLKEKAQIRDAFYTADANGNNTTLTVVIDGTLTDNYLMALGTKYVVLNNGQCADIIANDYTDATVTFTIKNENGDVISSNSSYVLRPETYTNSDVRIDEHKWTIGTDSAYLNWNTLSDGNPLYNHELLATDAFKMTVPVVSVDGNCLMQLGQIKVYAPGDEFILKSIQRGGQYSGWGPLTGPSLSGDYYFLEYFKSSDNYTAHDDNDGKGAYYLFEPRRPLYNNGTSTLTSSVSYYAYFNWNVKPGIDYLEGNHTYAAENEIINYTAEGDTAGTVDSNPGMIYTTMPIVKRDSVVFYPNNDYQKYTDKTGVETTKEKYVPGASYTGKRFNIVGNRGGYGTATVDGQSQTVEFQTVKGKTAETYNFPYEVQPTAINFSQSWERSIVDSVSYTITKANGSTQTFTASLNKYCAEIGSLSFSDALASAGEDARVSNVVVNWSQIKGNGAYATFDYLVTKTHKDGSAFQGGDLLQVGYNAVCSDDGKTFDTAANQTRYFYLSLGGQKCPWLVANGSSYQRYRAQDLDNDELSLCSALFLKGLSGGSYRNYLENPVIKLDAALTSVYGMDDPTCMLSGNMVMTKNMSGWKFTYTVYDTSSATTRSAEYTVPQLIGDTPLTRAELGLSDTEFFTDIQISYDGTFTFIETTQAKQSSGTGDGAVAGTYDITTLLRNIKAYTRPTALMTDTKLSTPTGTQDTYCTKPTMRFTASLTHSGTCDRPAHTGSGEEGACESIWNYPWYIVFANYSYTAIGPNFSVLDSTAKVTQGSTATATIDFALASKSNENYENMTDKYKTMPWVTPEAIYIELTDDQFDVDTSNTSFRQSLAAHGMTAQDVSVITTADKRHWVKLATAGNNVETLKPSSYAGTKNHNKFTIALKAWSGANVAVHNPFGEVYYDVSGLLTKYDGSEASGYVTENFNGAVSDDHGLLGDGDMTTARLWKGDMSDVKVEVLRNTVTGVTLLPGKNGIIEQSGVTTFEPDESMNLLASATINAPETELYNYTTVTYIPKKGDVTKYTQSANGQQIDGEKTCEFTMYLEGPAYTYRSSAENPTKVTYSYSKDGVNFVSADQIASTEWHNYRYIKTVVDIIAPYKSVETRYLLSSAYKKQIGDFHNYVGGTWSYQDGQGESANTTSGKMMYGEFIQTDFIMRGPAGSIWYDTNENGYNDNNEAAAKGLTLNLYSPVMDIIGYDGDTIKANSLIATTTTNADGSYELRSFIALEGQVVEIVMPDETYVVTRKTSKTFEEDKLDVTVKPDDSDFVRATDRETLPAFPKPMLENIGCGLVKIPVISANEVKLHIGTPATPANACGAVSTSENPNNLNPAIIYATESAAAAPAAVDATGSVTVQQTGMMKMSVSAKNTLADTDQKLDKDTVSTDYNIIVFANVKYDANKGDGTVPTDGNDYYPSTDAATDTVKTDSGSSFSKTGYLLAGWSENQNADCYNSSEYIKLGAEFQTGSRAADVTLYAIWKPIEYTVKFYKNTIESTYGSNLHGTPVGTTADESFVYDKEQKLTKNGYSLEGYGFTGWNSSADGSGTAYIDEQSVINLAETQGAEVTMYAQWKPHEYDITYDANMTYGKDADGNVLNYQTVTGTTADSHQVYSIASNLTENGYVLIGYKFVGWNTKEDGSGTAYADKQKIENLTSKDGDKLTFYAQWKLITRHITVVKVWDDRNDRYKFRPDELTVSLIADSGITYEKVTLKDDGNGNWTYTWNSLPVYVNGKEVKYRVTEEGMDGHAYNHKTNAGAVISKDGNTYTITNVLDKILGATVGTTDTIDPPVTKIITGDTPSSAETFSFQIKALTEGAPMPEGSTNGSKTVQISGSGTVEFGTMTYSTDNAGKTYEYEISEIKGSAENYKYDTAVYKMTVNVTADNGEDVVAEKVITDDSGKETKSVIFDNVYTVPIIPQTNTPKTGDSSNIILWVSILAASAVGVGVLIIVGKKKKKKNS